MLEHPEHTPDLIEAYLDDDLSLDARQRFEHSLRDDAELADELALATRIRQGLRDLPVQRCPETVVGHRPMLTALWQRLHHAMPRPVVWQGALAAFALALTTLWLLPPLGSPVAPVEDTAPLAVASLDTAPATSPEVLQAQHDVELAFAYLGRLGRTAESSVRQLAGEQIEQQIGEVF